MNKARFDKAFASFIRRGEEKITPKTFFQVLAEIEQERVQKTIELQAKIIAGKLRFETSPEIYVHDNTIVLGNQRIVARMS
jgi:N-dimethylarginine dimethylaminohydrolase